MVHRHEVSDAERVRLEPLLPKPRRGPRPRDLRRLINAMLWLDKTGVPRPDLPERGGRRHSCPPGS
jgi:transposase